MKVSCDNCGMTRDCVNYYAEDCGPNHRLWAPENGCECGNPEYGFDCVCKHVYENPGDKDYSCEFCGIYTASKPICNKCEED